MGGGTMRLGSRRTAIKETRLDGTESMAFRIYGGRQVISERYRNRYEVNTACVPALEAAGMQFTGQDDRGQRMEICELTGHPYFLACQYRPEFQSRPVQPSPPFLGFVLASARNLDKRLEEDGGVLQVGSNFDR